MTGALGVNMMLGAPPAALGVSRLFPAIERGLLSSGLGITAVSVTGHRFTSDSDIFDALDLPNARSFLSFDSAAARERIERLPWVAEVSITRVIPDGLEIKVKERKAAALWRNAGHDTLIDGTGHVLTAVRPGTSQPLPVVSGEGAAEETAGLLTLLSGYPAIASRLETAERVAGRRWTLHLKDAITIHLPSGREPAAMALLASSGTLKTAISTPHRVVDLRAEGRIAVRSDRGEIRVGELARH